MHANCIFIYTIYIFEYFSNKKFFFFQVYLYTLLKTFYRITTRIRNLNPCLSNTKGGLFRDLTILWIQSKMFTKGLRVVKSVLLFWIDYQCNQVSYPFLIFYIWCFNTLRGKFYEQLKNIYLFLLYSASSIFIS